MFTPSRAPFMLLILFCSSTILTAQESITAASSGEKMRFSSSARTCQIRMQIFAPSGEPLFDSTWRDGNVLDWPDGTAHLAGGSYRCVLTARDLDGQVTAREATLTAQNGHLSIETRGGADGMTVVGPDENGPKITLLAHDGVTGSVVSTSGDLSFRFGDFLSGKDVERMRLSAGGDLFVDGLIHASGIMLPDGTILPIAPGATAPQKTPAESNAPRVNPIVIVGPLTPAAAISSAGAKLTPKPNAGPDNQFKVDGTGVHIGTTSAFGLDVAGNVTLASNLDLPATTSFSAGVLRFGGNTFAHAFGTGNTFVGPIAGNFVMTGNSNTGTGYGSLGLNATGSRNTANGYLTLLFNNQTNADDNTAIGYEALYHSSSGNENTAVGSLALYNSVHAVRNTAIGYKALYSASAGVPGGDNSVAIGDSALLNVTTGAFNLAVGNNAGKNIATGSYNIDIANDGVSDESSTIRIGAAGVQTRTFIAGIRGVTPAPDGVLVYVDSNGQLGVAFSSLRYKFDVHDMSDMTDGLLRLRPVTFRYLAHGATAPMQYGLIAEEVADVYPEMVTRDKDGRPESVMYQFLAPMLLNEVQKQQRKIDELEADLTSLAQELKALERRLPAGR